MSIIFWQTEYETGYSEVDNQHRNLVNLINQLADAVSQGKGKDALSEILKNLVDATMSHFKHEQNMMASLSYAGYLNHRASHDVLVNELLDIVEKVDEDPSVLNNKLLQVLKDSLINHIVESDIPMTRDLKALESKTVKS